MNAREQIPSPIPLSECAPVWPPKYALLGVRISATDYQSLTKTIIVAAKLRRAALVSCHAVHAVVTFSQSEELCQQVNSFDAVTPDGQPVRWALNRLFRTGLKDRVYGPELMSRVCSAAATENVPIYLYGGTPETLRKLTDNLMARYPALKIAGSEAPPFRQLTPQEDAAVVNRVRCSGAGIVFIGLGCPKQDLFAYAHRETIAAVQICVGAAFDFHAGVKPTAPSWMQSCGLEWLYRLYQEPRRLWKRYTYTNIVFVLKFVRQWIGTWVPSTKLGKPTSLS